MDLPSVGTTHETSFLIEPQHTIPFPGLPAVVATPWVVWHMEATAYWLLAPSLPEGKISVGTRLEIDHLAPVPAGIELTCRAKVINVDGRVVTFHVEASDASEKISRGVHKRHIVDVIRLAQRIEQKSAAGQSG